MRFVALPASRPGGRLPPLVARRFVITAPNAIRKTGKIPPPKLLLHWQNGAMIAPVRSELRATPDWAKPIVACALQLDESI